MSHKILNERDIDLKYNSNSENVHRQKWREKINELTAEYNAFGGKG